MILKSRDFENFKTIYITSKCKNHLIIAQKDISVKFLKINNFY